MRRRGQSWPHKNCAVCAADYTRGEDPGGVFAAGVPYVASRALACNTAAEDSAMVVEEEDTALADRAVMWRVEPRVQLRLLFSLADHLQRARSETAETAAELVAKNCYTFTLVVEDQEKDPNEPTVVGFRLHTQQRTQNLGCEWRSSDVFSFTLRKDYFFRDESKITSRKRGEIKRV